MSGTTTSLAAAVIALAGCSACQHQDQEPAPSHPTAPIAAAPTTPQGPSNELFDIADRLATSLPLDLAKVTNVTHTPLERWEPEDKLALLGYRTERFSTAGPFEVVELELPRDPRTGGPAGWVKIEVGAKLSIDEAAVTARYGAGRVRTLTSYDSSHGAPRYLSYAKPWGELSFGIVDGKVAIATLVPPAGAATAARCDLSSDAGVEAALSQLGVAAPSHESCAPRRTSLAGLVVLSSFVNDRGCETLGVLQSDCTLRDLEVADPIETRRADREILEAAGWFSGGDRAAIARAYVTEVVDALGVVTTAPAAFVTAHKQFSPPTSTKRADGGVDVVFWAAPTGMRAGNGPDYTELVVAISADGVVGEAKLKDSL